MKKELNNTFDIVELEKYYTPKLRILGHLLIWILFALSMFLNYRYNVNIPFYASLFLSFRICTATLSTFYLFFYFILPVVLKYRKLYLLFLCFPILVIFWLLINKICYSVADLLQIDLMPLYTYLGKNPSPNFKQLFTFRYIILNTTSVVFALAPFFFVKIIVDLTRLYIRNIKSEKEKTNIEKQFLLAQLNPHFLFNTLNNIYGLIIKNDSNAGTMVLNLSSIMKYTLYENNLDKVPISKELDFIKNYFNINTARFSKETDIKLELIENQSITGLYIAPLITFILIENAFKYGLQQKNNKFLHIKIIIEDHTFKLFIENDNANFNRVFSENSGLGLTNVKKRLALLYPNKYILDIINNKDIFKVFLQLKLH